MVPEFEAKVCYRAYKTSLTEKTSISWLNKKKAHSKLVRKETLHKLPNNISEK